MEKQYRYPGTRPFQVDDRELFFGRKDDIEKLTELIVLEKLVLLFSKSGYGKSSLLNAGVIPRLNEIEKFQTLNIRLNDPDKNPVELLTFYLERKERESTFLESKFNIPSELSANASAILWYNAKSTQLARKDSPALVLIFDQFEELFNYSPAEVEDFGREIAGLLNPNLPESVRKLLKRKMESSKDYLTKAETEFLLEPLNLKVLFSLRSDRISLLNQLKGYIPAIFKKTYELQPLNKTQALEALLEPAEKEGDFASPPFSYSKDAKILILNSLLDKDHQRIETFQLQLICQHVEELIINKYIIDPNATQFELTAAELGKPEDIFEQHYNTIIKSLPKENQLDAKILIEDKLIVGGNRVPLPESVIIFEHRIPEHLLKTLVDKRLLRSEPNTVGGTSYELSHDTLVAPIQKTAQIRRELEAKQQAERERSEKMEVQRRLKKTRSMLGAAVLGLVLAILAAIFAYTQSERARQQTLAAQQSEFRAVKSDSLAQIDKNKAIMSDSIAQFERDNAIIALISARKSDSLAQIDKNKAIMSDSIAQFERDNAIVALISARKSDSLAQIDKRNAEASRNEFRNQALISKALLLNSTAKDLLAKGLNTEALRVGEAAYATALQANPEPPIQISNLLASAFYYKNPFQLLKVDQKSAISSVAFSPDGKYILTGGFMDNPDILWGLGGFAIRWGLNGKRAQAFEGHQGTVSSVSFSPDGKHILTGSSDGTAVLWGLDGKRVQAFEGHQGDVSSVAFSPDGKQILTGSNWYGFPTILLWGLDGKQVQAFEGHQGDVSSVAFSPDGKHILTGSSDSTAVLWRLDGIRVQTFEGHQGGVSSVAFSPDGKQILTGSWDGTAILWGLDGKRVQAFEGHMGSVLSVVFSPDGKQILTGSRDKTAILWGLSGKRVQAFEGHKGDVSSVAFSPDGKQILTESSDGTAILWGYPGKRVQAYEGHQGDVSSVAFSPDGKQILTGSRDETAILWGLDGKRVQTFEGNMGSVLSVAFSPDGKQVLTGNAYYTAILWELDGKRVHAFEGALGPVSSVAFSPDGKYILTGSSDGIAVLWGLDGKRVQAFEGHLGSLSSVAFSPDGKQILTQSADNTAILWGLDGKQIQIFVGHQEDVNSVAFSADGKQIFTGSDETAILEGLGRERVKAFEGNQGTVSSVAFSPDGKYILTRSRDNTAILGKTPKGIYKWLQSPDCPIRQLTQEEKVQYAIIEEEN